LLSEGKLAVFTVQRTIPLSAGIPLVLVDIKLLAKIMPSVTITLLFIQKCMSKTFIWGPVIGQKHHARMSFLPLTPLKYFIWHTFLNTERKKVTITCFC